MAYVQHRTPCCRSKWEQKHGKGGQKEESIPNNVIKYAASEKLTEISGSNTGGINTDYIDANIVNHTFENGVGIITFDQNITEIKKGSYPGRPIGAFTGSNLIDIIIPNSVISINDYAFQNCFNLTSITIGNNVTSIGNSAFEKCTSLTSITIPNSVTSIGNGAFQNCSSLISVEIPNSVTNIGQRAFDGTTWYNNQSDGLIYVGKIAYKYKGTMPNNTHITLLEGTLGIAGSAFQDCSGLTSIEIPNSITSINSGAFSGCSSLTSITIPDSVSTIGNSTFTNCNNLTSIEISNSITSIDSRMFWGCSRLTSLEIPDSVIDIETQAFYNCTDLTSIKFSNSITNIETQAFYNCTDLTSIILPESLTSIGYGCFNQCSRLESVTVLPTTPPSMIGASYYGGMFNNTSANLVIYVLAESVDAYKAAEGWSTYADRIQAIQN